LSIKIESFGILEKGNAVPLRLKCINRNQLGDEPNKTDLYGFLRKVKRGIGKTSI
jgi:hypothetical protein